MSKGLYEIFETDHDLETGGLTLKYGEIEVTIARAGGANRKFASIMEQKMRPYRTSINLGTLDETTAQQLLAEAYSEAVILGWKGVKGRDGKTIAFTKTNVVKVLLDLPDFFNDIREQSERVANFTVGEVAIDAKS
jgi:hypothetical protein